MKIMAECGIHVVQTPAEIGSTMKKAMKNMMTMMKMMTMTMMICQNYVNYLEQHQHIYFH